MVSEEEGSQSTRECVGQKQLLNYHAKSNKQPAWGGRIMRVPLENHNEPSGLLRLDFSVICAALCVCIAQCGGKVHR